MDIHSRLALSNIFEQRNVVEHVDGRLVVQEDPSAWDAIASGG